MVEERLNIQLYERLMKLEGRQDQLRILIEQKMNERDEIIRSLEEKINCLKTKD